MRRSLILILRLVVVLVLVLTLSVQVISSEPPDQKRVSTSATLEPQATTIIVTSTADSGPGTLRQALLDAQSGEVITFDPTAFPPTSPMTIGLTIGLPHIITDSLTLRL